MYHGEKIILLIDDDATNIFALTAILKSRGYKYLTAREMHTAYAHLEAEPRIGIILMDMMIPVIDGYTATPQLKQNEQYAAIPVIAVTAQAMKGDREKCLDAGADEYIPKPIDVDRLDELLKKYL
ncbi:MAG: response regulator [Ferruginibacter sp.]